MGCRRRLLRLKILARSRWHPRTGRPSQRKPKGGQEPEFLPALARCCASRLTLTSVLVGTEVEVVERDRLTRRLTEVVVVGVVVDRVGLGPCLVGGLDPDVAVALQ